MARAGRLFTSDENKEVNDEAYFGYTGFEWSSS